MLPMNTDSRTNSGLRYDDQGFLIGEVVQEFSRANDDIAEIAQNTKAILDFLTANAGGKVIEHSPVAQPVSVSSKPVLLDGKQSVNHNSYTNHETNNSNSSSSSSVNNSSANSSTKEKSVIRSSNASESVSQPKQRDSSGRFVSGSSQSSNSSSSSSVNNSSAEDIKNRQENKQLIGGVVDAISNFSQNNAQLDPAIAVMSEISTPVSRVIQGFSWAKQKKEQVKQSGLMRKIGDFVFLSKLSQEKSDKKTHKVLKEILEKPMPSQGSGLLSKIMGAMIAPVLVALAAILAALKAFAKLAVGAAGKTIGLGGFGAGKKTTGSPNGKTGTVATPDVKKDKPAPQSDGKKTGTPSPTSSQPGKGKQGDGDSSSQKTATQQVEKGKPSDSAPSKPKQDGRFVGTLKKLPFIGALIAGGYAVNEIASNNSDTSKTEAEKNTENGRIFGGVAGALTGAAAGASIGAALGSVVPVIGTALGGIIGGIGGAIVGDIAGQGIGEKIGASFESMKAGVDSFITSSKESFSSFSQSVKDSWASASDYAKNTYTSMAETAKNVFSGFSEKFKSVTESISTAFSSVTEKANTYVKELTGVDVKEAVTKTVEATKAAAVATVETIKETAKATYSAAKEKVSESASYVSKNTLVGKAASYAADKATGFFGKIKSDVTGKTSENKKALTDQMTNAGIADPKEQAMFLAQMSHESGGFRSLSENLNYRSAESIKQTFKGNKALSQLSDEQVQGLVGNPEALASVVYGSRMGNTEAGDGYKFRGRGFTQLTGKNNYEAASKSLGIDLVNNPELAEKPEIAAKIATWFWQNNKSIGEHAKNGNVMGVTKAINGGYNGLEDRKGKYQSFLKETSEGKYIANNATTKTSPSGVSVETTGGNLLANNTVVSNASSLPAIKSQPAAPVVDFASVPVPSVKPVPQMSAANIPAEPAINDGVFSGGKSSADKNASTSSQTTDANASRDIHDRRIAHIVTGGMSGV